VKPVLAFILVALAVSVVTALLFPELRRPHVNTLPVIYGVNHSFRACDGVRLALHRSMNSSCFSL
jgi:hypothetical protein